MVVVDRVVLESSSLKVRDSRATSVNLPAGRRCIVHQDRSTDSVERMLQVSIHSLFYSKKQDKYMEDRKLLSLGDEKWTER